MKKTALIISAALTAFVLIMLGGVIFAINSPRQASAAGATPTLDPTIQQQINDREAAYQNMIAEANSRLEQAQKQIQELQSQVNAQQVGAQQASSPAPSQPVTIQPDKAAQVAANYLGNDNIYSVESTLINGITTYQVTFSSGDIVYVSLDGQVIGSQPAPQTASNANTLPSSQGRHYEHDDHEHDD